MNIKTLGTTFEPSATSPSPLAEQLASVIRRGIGDGSIPAGALLPPADHFEHVSHPTVLHAYKILRHEGLVRSQRAKGTVVLGGTKTDCFGILVETNQRFGYEAMYTSSLFSALLQELSAKRSTFRIYALDEGSKDAIPVPLRRDVEESVLRGLFIPSSIKDNRLLTWLRGCQVEHVFLLSDERSPGVDIDGPGMLRTGLGYLYGAGCRSVSLLSTLPTVPLEDLQCEAAENWPDLSVTTRRLAIDTYTASGVGLREGAAICNGPLPDAVFITDDWVGLSVLMALQQNGYQPGRDVRVLIACNRGQLAEALAGCDRLIADMRDVAKAACEMMDRRLSGETPLETISKVGLSLIPHNKDTLNKNDCNIGKDA